MNRFALTLALLSLTFLAYSRTFAAEVAAVPVKGMEEVLVPIGDPRPEDRVALLAARDQFLARSEPEDLSTWTAFLAATPNSAYALSIWTNLGILHFRAGRFSRCLESYETAWRLGKDIRNQPAEAVAGRAAGELATMYARLGRYQQLEEILAATEKRGFRGPGSNLLDGARSGFELMKESPQTSFRCGPMALYRILVSQKSSNPLPPEITNSASTREGISLKQVKEIAGQVGLASFRPLKRAPGSAVVIPSVVHWKVGHYAALVAERDGRYLIEDPTFASGLQIWITPATLDDEASGYFLAKAEPPPAGWTEVSDEEAGNVWGKGQTSNGDPDATSPDDKKAKGKGGASSGTPGRCPRNPNGMAIWDIHLMLVSLNLMDEPLSYTPPVGPGVSILVTYNSRENETISTPVHTNFGPKWSYNGLAYVNDTGGVAFVRSGTGGLEKYLPSSVANEFHINKTNHTVLKRISADPHFERTWPDGTRELYEAVGPTGLAYRTKLIDPSGNQLEYQYTITGSTILLSKIVDEIGQETSFEYGGAGTTVSKVTDPFGRFAQFTYDGQGRLVKIRDTIGLESQFRYEAGSDFIEALITPYGETLFQTGVAATTRWLQITHPNGDLERAEFRHNAEGIPGNLGAAPTGVMVDPNYNNYRNSLFWDRKAMKEAAGDISKARLTHFLHTPDFTVTSGKVESEKAALEGRVYFNYEGQTTSNVESDSSRVTKIGRLLDDGSTQLYQMEYNAIGKLTSIIDPLGRTTSYTYAANLHDLLEIRQKTGPATTALISSFTYDAQGHPLTSTDAAGEVTTFTYNARGQVLTSTDPAGQTTAFTYDTNGYLLTVDGPAVGTGDSITYTHDAAGRPFSVASGAGLSMQYTYDNLNRVTKRTYSDGAFEEWTYENLNVKSYRDRGGRILTYQINSLGQIVEVADQDGKKTFFAWCKCGAMSRMIDALGNMTRITHDVQGRPTSKIYPDGSTTTILYEPEGGRIAKVVDEEGREQNFTYANDDRTVGLSFSNTSVATPAVTYTWDSIYPRLTGYTDASGATALQYHPLSAGQAGAGKLASIDGPLANDTISLVYDELGRLMSRSVNGNPESYLYDSLNRATSVTNALGTSVYTYEGSSGRAATMTLANAQTAEFDYYNAAGLNTLKEIVHAGPGGTPISAFTYAYNSRPQISSVTRKIENGAPLLDTTSYDAQGRLSGYTQALSGGGSKLFNYSYDAAQNRVSETIGGIETIATPNNLNQLTSVSAPAFSDRTYEWDAVGRITAFVQGTHRSEFSYDALGRRVRILEKENGSTTADRRFIWEGLQILEERDGSNSVVKRFFSQGFTAGGTSFFYTRDHLGSIREVVDASGAVRARYDYDPFGRRTKISGDLDADFGYGGHYFHELSGLSLTYARAYDASLGRWLSRDPLGEPKGLNLYAYAYNDPLNFSDPVGYDSVFGAWENPGAVLDEASCNLMDGIHDAVIDFQNLASAAQAALCVAVVINPASGPVVVGGALLNGGLATYSAGVGAANKVGGKFGVETGLSGTATVDAAEATGFGKGSSCDLTSAAQAADGLLNLATGRAIGNAAPRYAGPIVDAAVAASYAKGTADGGFLDPIIDAAKDAAPPAPPDFPLPNRQSPPRNVRGGF